eukprot:CAMPEP_0176402666 /NCGR_PEP_ID=MMETSP0126-20121128/49464_1 /TAXON_ID=141414 ORGANISM="Strombidinopsis acuminatum, Strain SPMC142" /NCGR_SAMPLE_ID=MMETSP0126 /ASSEMBLY_ACC=CAM_ASM_000229 /LENGTH=128 /DNA_ID=CAMNT_0017780427 /DNA_START=547 /DNA_END=933 /DNA_ORIENTATION=+
MLKAPDVLNQADMKFGEFINLYRFDERYWKLVDVDHYMGGNPYFSKFKTKEKFSEEVNAVMGDVNKSKVYLTEEKQYDALQEQLAEHFKWQENKEPMSNFSMPIVHARRAFWKEKQAKLEEEAKKLAE